LKDATLFKVGGVLKKQGGIEDQPADWVEYLLVALACFTELEQRLAEQQTSSLKTLKSSPPSMPSISIPNLRRK